jgi:hypothetical protein
MTKKGERDTLMYANTNFFYKIIEFMEKMIRFHSR